MLLFVLLFVAIIIVIVVALTFTTFIYFILVAIVNYSCILVIFHGAKALCLLWSALFGTSDPLVCARAGNCLHAAGRRSTKWRKKRRVSHETFHGIIEFGCFLDVFVFFLERKHIVLCGFRSLIYSRWVQHGTTMKLLVVVVSRYAQE